MSAEEIRSAVTSSHIAVAKVEVLDGDTVLGEFPVTNGSVTADLDNAIQRTCLFDVVDPVGDFDAWMMPGQYEVKLSRGVQTSTAIYRNESKPRVLITRNAGTALQNRLEALGYDVTVHVGASLDIIKDYDIVVQDGHAWAWDNNGGGDIGNPQGVIDAYAAGVSVLTIGNDSSSVGPLASSGTHLSQTIPGKATPRNSLHPLGAAWPEAGVSNTDDRTYLKGLAPTTIVFAAYPAGVDKVDRVVGVAQENDQLARWAHLNTVAAPNSVLDAMIAWVATPRSKDVVADHFVSLGIFTLSDDTRRASTSLVACSGSDRARRVSRASLTDYYVIPFNTNYATAIRDLVNSRVSGLTYSFTSTDKTTPLLVFSPQDDPWAKAQEMAASIGCELFFDREGVCVLRPVPDPNTAPLAATYTEGVSATLLDVTRRRDDEGTFNHIIIVGASIGSTAPVLAEAKDENQDSPTYIGGPFGDVPKWITSGYITTLAQAQAQADAELTKVLGLAEKVDVEVVVDPTLSPGDVIEVAASSALVSDRYVVDSFTVPLAPSDSMTLTTRQKRK